ncbi:MAG: serine/threonine protein kinase, partial [Nannocystaceae bacterium]|nr:serine/threonine protein kinase [Nannocystaceae bacterium]
MTDEHDDPTLVGEQPEHEARLAEGVAVGRYVIRRRIGAGAMGVVYAAHDPKLDRPVAVKLLHVFAEQSEERARQGQLRLGREARAMARLTHSNVVTVHDVGECDGHVFIAMDLVDGVTLSRWLRDVSPSIAEIIEVFVQAGRGLSAAHAAGLVHRDFKPDNVMVCHDARGRLTRVLVMDFGLARNTEHAADVAAMAADVAAVTHEVSVPDDTTRTAGVHGTPAYMSPEQHLGNAVGAPSDQFSYCVALYEALLGHRPFEGEGVAALAFAVIEGKVRETPPKREVPQWLVQLVVRGLSARPEARWPSMDVLLGELSRERGRRVRVGAVAGVLLVVGVAAWASAGERDDPCADVAREVIAAWHDAAGDGAQRQRLDGAQAAVSGVTSIASAMDTYAAGWAEARVQACRDARRGDRDAVAPRLACLEGRRRHFMAVVSLLTRPVAQWGEDPGKAVAALPPLGLCADTAYLAAQVEPPRDETLRIAVAGLRTTLSRIEVLEDAGRYSEAVVLGEPALLHARALGYAPATAEAAHRLGVAHLELGQTSTAIALLEEAYLAASAAEHTLVAARAAIALVFAHGVNERHADDARTWIEHARVQVERAARPRSLQCALRTTEAAVAWTETRY